MEFLQRELLLRARPRGFHLVTDEIIAGVPELADLRDGLVHIHIMHTSAALTINENASRDVLRDFAQWFDRAVPDGTPYFEHTIEGPDDMPAHIKSSLLGSGVTVPIRHGRLLLGTWQGVYLCEHRDHGGQRRVVVTAFGHQDMEKTS
jgi:secondary thiamine-phosphate synthase enzyme